MNTLPNYEKVVIPIEKLTKYALDPKSEPDKATAFRLALGYKISNANALINNIRNNLVSFECKEKDNKGHGMRYEVIMSLVGENGRTANVLTAWIDDKVNGEMRMTSAYVTKKKGAQYVKRV